MEKKVLSSNISADRSVPQDLESNTAALPGGAASTDNTGALGKAAIPPVKSKIWRGADGYRIPSHNHPDRAAWDQRYMDRIKAYFQVGDKTKIRQFNIPIKDIEPSHGILDHTRTPLYVNMLKAKDRLPPIVVGGKSPSGKYQILDGNRRLIAAQKAKATHLPAVEIIEAIKKSESIGVDLDEIPPHIKRVYDAVRHPTVLLDSDRKKEYQGSKNRFKGHCYVGAEALYHLLGGKKAGWTPFRMPWEGDMHWWIQHNTGTVLDPTAEQFKKTPDYTKGRGGGFLTKDPSDRAKKVMGRARLVLDATPMQKAEEEIDLESLEKAIKDLPAGKPLRGGRYDYSHLLSENLRNQGYSLHVLQGQDPIGIPSISAEVYRKPTPQEIDEDDRERKSAWGDTVGWVDAFHDRGEPADPKGGKTAREPSVRINEASIDHGHRGKGLGTAAYEAIFAHALQVMHTNHIRHGVHSTMAHRVIQKLHDKHGFEGSTGEPVGAEDTHSNHDPDAEAYDQAYGKADYTIKAIAAMPIGTQLKANQKTGEAVWDYSHIPDSRGLPATAKGYRIHLRVKPKTKEWFTTLYHHNGTAWQPVGHGLGTWGVDDDGHVSMKPTFVEIPSSKHRGKDLAFQMYSSMLTHGKHMLGATHLLTDDHSSAMSGVYRKLAKLHGLQYPNKPNIRGRSHIGADSYDSEGDWLYSPSGDFDHKYAGFKSLIKASQFYDFLAMVNQRLEENHMSPLGLADYHTLIGARSLSSMGRKRLEIVKQILNENNLEIADEKGYVLQPKKVQDYLLGQNTPLTQLFSQEPTWSPDQRDDREQNERISGTHHMLGIDDPMKVHDIWMGVEPEDRARLEQDIPGIEQMVNSANRHIFYNHRTNPIDVKDFLKIAMDVDMSHPESRRQPTAWNIARHEMRKHPEIPTEQWFKGITNYNKSRTKPLTDEQMAHINESLRLSGKPERDLSELQAQWLLANSDGTVEPGSAPFDYFQPQAFVKDQDFTGDANQFSRSFKDPDETHWETPIYTPEQRERFYNDPSILRKQGIDDRATMSKLFEDPYLTADRLKKVVQTQDDPSVWNDTGLNVKLVQHLTHPRQHEKATEETDAFLLPRTEKLALINKALTGLKTMEPDADHDRVGHPNIKHTSQILDSLSQWYGRRGGVSASNNRNKLQLSYNAPAWMRANPDKYKSDTGYFTLKHDPERDFTNDDMRDIISTIIKQVNAVPTPEPLHHTNYDDGADRVDFEGEYAERAWSPREIEGQNRTITPDEYRTKTQKYSDDWRTVAGKRHVWERVLTDFLAPLVTKEHIDAIIDRPSWELTPHLLRKMFETKSVTADHFMRAAKNHPALAAAASGAYFENADAPALPDSFISDLMELPASTKYAPLHAMMLQHPEKGITPAHVEQLFDKYKPAYTAPYPKAVAGPMGEPIGMTDEQNEWTRARAAAGNVISSILMNTNGAVPKNIISTVMKHGDWQDVNNVLQNVKNHNPVEFSDYANAAIREVGGRKREGNRNQAIATALSPDSNGNYATIGDENARRLVRAAGSKGLGLLSSSGGWVHMFTSHPIMQKPEFFDAMLGIVSKAHALNIANQRYGYGADNRIRVAFNSLAERKDLTPDQFKKLLAVDTDGALGIAESTANSTANPEVLQMLANHESADVRAALVNNTEAPADIIEKLVGDPDKNVAKQARNALSWIHPDKAGHKGQVTVKFDTNKLRKVRDLILASGQPSLHPKKLPPGNWNAGRDEKGNISAAKIQQHIDSLPGTIYNFTEDTWDGGQQHSEIPSQVFQLNLTTDQANRMKNAGVWQTFRNMYDDSHRSGHPNGPAGIGWVRWTGDDQGIHIDEVQSDFGQSFMRRLAAEAAAAGQTPEEQAETMRRGEERWPEEHGKIIKQILFGDRHPSETLQEAFQEYLRTQEVPNGNGKAQMPTECPHCKEMEERHAKATPEEIEEDYDMQQWLRRKKKEPRAFIVHDINRRWDDNLQDYTKEKVATIRCNWCNDESYVPVTSTKAKMVGVPIHIWQPESKAQISLGNPDEKLPGHFYVGYRDIPTKRMGWEPGEYGELPTQESDSYRPSEYTNTENFFAHKTKGHEFIVNDYSKEDSETNLLEKLKTHPDTTDPNDISKDWELKTRLKTQRKPGAPTWKGKVLKHEPIDLLAMLATNYSLVDAMRLEHELQLPFDDAMALQKDEDGEPLVKMAQVHNGPHPMTVFRIESDTGKGPYQEFGNVLGVGNEHGLNYPNRPQFKRVGYEESPPPWEDFPQEDLAGSGFSRKQPFFGFMHPSDALAWFGRHNLRAMADAGFHLRAVPAAKIWLSNSGRQVMFHPHESYQPGKGKPVVWGHHKGKPRLSHHRPPPTGISPPIPEDPAFGSVEEDKLFEEQAKAKAATERVNEIMDKSIRDPTPKQCVAMWVEDHTGKVLWGKRRDGKWTLPAGHANPYEDPDAAAIRELWEEANITPSVMREQGTAKTKEGFPLHIYTVITDGVPSAHNDPDREIQEWHWFDPVEGFPAEVLQNQAHQPNAVLRWMGYEDGDSMGKDEIDEQWPAGSNVSHVGKPNYSRPGEAPEEMDKFLGGSSEFSGSFTGGGSLL